nr:MAG: hypothetical protein [Microvirus sp.]
MSRDIGLDIGRELVLSIHPPDQCPLGRFVRDFPKNFTHWVRTLGLSDRREFPIVCGAGCAERSSSLLAALDARDRSVPVGQSGPMSTAAGGDHG